LDCLDQISYPHQVDPLELEAKPRTPFSESDQVEAKARSEGYQGGWAQFRKRARTAQPEEAAKRRHQSIEPKKIFRDEQQAKTPACSTLLAVHSRECRQAREFEVIPATQAIVHGRLGGEKGWDVEVVDPILSRRCAHPPQNTLGAVTEQPVFPAL